MANTILHYRIFLNETLRKFLGINLNNKKIYIFKVNHITYISTDMIPTNLEFEIIKVILGNVCWFVDLPRKWFEYKPKSYKLLNTKGKVIKFI